MHLTKLIARFIIELVRPPNSFVRMVSAFHSCKLVTGTMIVEMQQMTTGQAMKRMKNAVRNFDIISYAYTS